MPPIVAGSASMTPHSSLGRSRIFCTREMSDIETSPVRIGGMKHVPKEISSLPLRVEKRAQKGDEKGDFGAVRSVRRKRKKTPPKRGSKTDGPRIKSGATQT